MVKPYTKGMKLEVLHMNYKKGTQGRANINIQYQLMLSFFSQLFRSDFLTHISHNTTKSHKDFSEGTTVKFTHTQNHNLREHSYSSKTPSMST